jgi:hypothetical protein
MGRRGGRGHAAVGQVLLSGWSIPVAAPPGLTGFIQSTIIQVFPPIYRGGQLFLSWASSAPAGTWFQVYVNGALAWHGLTTSCWVPSPPGPVHVDIGTVAAGKEQVDYSAANALPVAPARRAELSWTGGTFEDVDIAGFRVYGEPTSGAGINYTTALADLTAYPQGIATDGFGLGGFGTGGFGQVGGTYAWTSEPLEAGTWSFAVKPFDTAGNLGTAATVVVTIYAPPREPGLYPDGVTRLKYSLLGYGQVGYGSQGFGLPEAVLTWNASPSA